MWSGSNVFRLNWKITRCLITHLLSGFPASVSAACGYCTIPPGGVACHSRSRDWDCVFSAAVPSFMKPEHLFSPSFFFTRSPCCFDSIVSFLNASSLLVPEEWWVFTLCSAYGGRNLPLVLTFFYCFVHPVPTNKFFFFFLPLVSNLKLHSCVFAFSFPLQRRPLSCKMFGL